MSSNYHDEAGPSFSRLSYEYEWRNELNARLLLALLTPSKKFINADTFCFVEPWACGPPLSVGSIGWICQVKVNVRSSKDGASPIYRSRSGAKTNTPATYCTGPSTRHSTLVESKPTTTVLRSNSWAAAGQQLPYTDIDSFFVPGPTSQPFAGWSEVSLVW